MFSKLPGNNRPATWIPTPCIVGLLLLFLGSSCTPGFQVEETTIAQVHGAMERGELTAQELVQKYLDRIEAYDKQGPFINSLVTINPGAMERARELDDLFAQSGFVGPLHGIPVIVKDNYDTFDLPTTNGTLALKGSIPPDDAFQVRRLREAGAIILAKSNLAEFASSGSFTVSSILPGYTHNPYDPLRSTAGSSGGTGAAIAANFATVGLGTDTGSSIRGPASHQSLVGFRTTMGLSSRDGIAPLSASRDVGGPMARTVEDAVVVLEVIAGSDPADPVTSRSEGNIPENYRQFLEPEGLSGARIGVLRQLFEIEDTFDQETPQTPLESSDTPSEHDGQAGDSQPEDRQGDSRQQHGRQQDAGNRQQHGDDSPQQQKQNEQEESQEEPEPRKVHPEILRLMDQALADLKAAGASVLDPIEIADMDEIRKDFPRIRRLKYDFEKYLATRPEVPFKTIEEILESGDFHPYLRLNLERTKEVDYVPEEHEDYPKYLETEERLRAAVLKVMEENQLDALIYPTFNYPPRLIGDLNTGYGGNSGTLSPPTGFPAFNVPMGFSFGRLPAGLQFLGRPFAEGTLIRLCYAYEQATHHRRPPDTTPPLR